MSREIKFRIWDRGKESLGVSPRMSDPFGLFNFPSVHFSSDGDSIPLMFARDEERFVVMQFTGLLDANGVEIYEGDIVLQHRLPDFFPSDKPYTRTIAVNEPEYPELMAFSSGGPDGDDKVIRQEVIGNVYESPELLEGATK